MAVKNSANAGKQSARAGARKTSRSFTSEERAAMRERAKELKLVGGESEMLAAEKRIIENVKSGKRSMQ